MSIRARLRLLTGISIGTLCLVMGAASYTTAEINKSVQDLYNHPLLVKPAAINAAYRMERMVHSLRLSIEENREDILYRSIEDAQREYEAILASLDIVRDRVFGEAGKALERETRKRFLAWTPNRNRIIAAALRHDHHEASLALWEDSSSALEDLRDGLDKLVAYTSDHAAGLKLSADKSYEDGRRAIFVIFIVSIAVLLSSMIVASRSILSLIGSLSRTMGTFETTGELRNAPDEGDNEIARMARTFNGLIRRIRKEAETKDVRAALLAELTAQTSQASLAAALAKASSEWIGAQAGAVYSLSRDNEALEYVGGWGEKPENQCIRFGDGLIGQTAIDKKLRIVTGSEASSRRIRTGFSDLEVRSLIEVPLLFGEELVGVGEYLSLSVPTEEEAHYLQTLHDSISPYLRAIVQSQRIAALHAEAMHTQAMAEKEAARATDQAAALAEANSRLEEQRTEVERQSGELRTLNEELMENAAQLQARKLEAEEHSKKLEAASRYKSDFMSRMSHELRTPLNSLLILARELAANQGGNLKDDQLEAATIIQKSGMDLLSLIESILDLSKIESGKMTIQVDEVRIAALVENLKKLFSPIAQERGLSLSFDVEASVPAVIHSDSMRIMRVLSNLLSNALKFTEEGGVEVSVGQNGGRILFKVSDSGIGIPEAMKDLVFQPFEQADSSISRKYGGSGLGLAIAHESAKLLGGTLELSDRFGGGSVFIFSIPASLKNAPVAEPSVSADDAGKPMPHPALEGKTALIVDDDMRNLFALSRALDGLGMHVVKADSAERALSALAENPEVSVVLTDLMMPGISGAELIREIRKNRNTSQMRVIAVSAKAAKADRDECIEAGADDYISKPVDVDKLASLLHLWLST